MGNFREHTQQAKNNLKILSEISSKVNDSWDWQVTICFYSALHLINAHVVEKTGVNYITHGSLEGIINPYNEMSLGKLNEDTYVSYTSLLQLSRRSRYLLDTNNYKKEGDVKSSNFAYSKHLKKSIKHLEVVINFIKENYDEDFPKVDIKCIDLQNKPFENFTVST